jgi:hypothetical protein
MLHIYNIWNRGVRLFWIKITLLKWAQCGVPEIMAVSKSAKNTEIWA